MALKDCMKKLGKPLSKADTELLEGWLEQGLTDDQVLQRYELHIDKTLVDITKRAQAKGAKVSMQRDVLGEVRSFNKARISRINTRLAKVRAEHGKLSQAYGEINYTEGTIKSWEPGGPPIDIYDDGALVVRFRQMLFLHKAMFRGAGLGQDAGNLKGRDANELRDNFRAMQANADKIRDDMYTLFLEEVELVNQIEDLSGGQSRTLDEEGNYREGPKPPDGVSEESWSYTFTTGPQAPAAPPFTIKTGKGAEGDLYIQRVGPNAGTPHRTRQGPSDMAISLNQDMLLPDYMFYLLQYLAPQMQARAHGTAQQAINKRDVEDVITQHFKNQVREDTGDFYANNQPTTPGKVAEEAVANYKAIVRVQEEREIATGITKVTTANDAAHVLAELRRNASEGFWALVLDKDDNVVGVVEHGRGTIDGTSVYPSTYAGAVHTIPGAAKIWMAHNHPSGVLTASDADRRITKRIGALMDGSGIEVMGHVLMGASQTQFTLMDKNGDTVSQNNPITPAARNKRVKVFTRKLIGKQSGPTVRSPAEMMVVLARMGNPEGVLMLNNRHQVLGFMSMTPEEMTTLKTGQSGRLMRAFAEMNAAAFVVSTKAANPDAANNMGAFANASDWRMLDAIFLDAGGRQASLAQVGGLQPASEFFQQSNIGFTSGLLTAVQTMSREKGTAAEMLGSLRKIKRNKKGEMVTTYAAGVTKAEMDWLDLEEWAALKEAPEESLPSATLRVKGAVEFTEVLQNPTDAEFRLFRQSIRMEYKELGLSTTEDPLTRTTWDENGNRFVWQADRVVHIVMEEDLARVLGVDPATLSQHNDGKVAKARTITRQEMIDYVRANGIIVEEASAEGQQAYQGQSLPGGGMPRDLFLKMPEVPEDTLIHSFQIVMGGVPHDFVGDIMADEIFSWMAGEPQMEGADIGREGQGIEATLSAENITETQYDLLITKMNTMGLQAQDEETTDFVRAPDRQGPGLLENYPISYFPHKNIIVWMRTTERTGPGGERILMIEEVQSKWHQQGAKFGYRRPIRAVPKKGEFTVDKNEFGWFARELDGSVMQFGNQELIDAGGEVVRIPLADTDSAELAAVGLITVMKVRHKEELAKQGQRAPDAPFKGRGWSSLAMKRMIRLAAEEGYDQIAWTTGETQNIRGNLATYAERVSYDISNSTLFVEGKAGTADRSFGVEITEFAGIMGEGPAAALEAAIDEVERWYESHFDEEENHWYIIDGNAEVMYDGSGELLVADTESEMREVLHQELNYQDIMAEISGDDLDLMIGRRAQAMPNYYDRELVNLTNDAAQKLDKTAAVVPFGQEIYTTDGAPFSHELRRAQGLRSQSTVGWYVVDYHGRQTNGPFENEDMAKGVAGQRNETTETVHTLQITDQMRAAALEGQTLMQNKKGAISFDQARRGIIKLTESRDLSTFMHEAGHLYLETMRYLNEQDYTPQAVKDDYAKILEYLGVGPDGVITRDQHELWARSFEKYLQEGNAPSVALQSAFNAFRRWLTEIWKRMKGDSPDGLILTPEIRDVMDRILASDDQIAVANATQEFSAMFQTAEQMGVTQRVFDVYKANIVKANNEAVEKETVRLMAAANRAARIEWREEKAKVRAQVEAEAYEQHIFQAFALLAHGTQPDGSPLETGSPFKIDKESLLALLQGSKPSLARLPKPWVYRVKGGVDVDVAAKALGYRDGLELVKALMEMPNMQDWITVTTEERMQALFPDPLLDGSVSENAVQAVHNEKRGAILAAEMRELRRLMREDAKIVGATKQDIKQQQRDSRLANKGTLPKRAELALIKRGARDTIDKMRVMDVRPEVYLNAERRAGRLAFEANGRGDFEKAYLLKRQQIVNFEMYRAAVRAKERAVKTRNYLAKFSKARVIQRLGKLGVIEPILAILEGIELKKVSLKEINRRGALQSLAQQIHDGEVVTPIAEFLYHIEYNAKGDEIVVLNEAPFKNWQELTIEELEGLRDIIKQLEHQAKKKLEMMVNGELVVMADAALELTEQVLEVNDVVDVGVGQKTRLARAKQAKESGIAHWLGPSVMARVLDKQGWGATTRLIIVTMRRAIAEKLVPLQQKAINDVSQLYLKYYSKGLLGWRTKELRQLENKGFATINGESLSKADVIFIAMNMGNEGNKSAIYNGVRIDGKIAYPEAEVQAALDKLDARDWNFVQAMWDYLDTYWDALSAMEKERRGISPERVERVPFTVETSDGQTLNLSGGYMPLSYNYEHSERHEERVFEDHYKNMGNGVYVSANTRAGATHNRVKNHNMVVQLGLFQIEKHLKEITRDIAIGNEVNFAKNLLNDKAYRNAMKNTGNATALRELTLWLTDAAVGELPANNMVERAMAYTRVGFTVSKLAFNVYTTLLQMTGIFQSLVSLGKQAMVMGVGRVMRNPVSAWTDARDASAFLRARYGWKSQAFDKDIHDAAGVLSEYGPGLPTTGRRIKTTAARAFFFPIAKFQQVVDVITWWGAIWKGRNDLGLDEQEAIHYADAQVELGQTSGFFSDRSGIERGTLSATTRQNQFIRLWTTLISYMQRKGGIAYMKTQELKDDLSFTNATLYAVDMLLLFTLEGVASSMIYGRWDWDEDDPSELLLSALKETGLSAAAGIPFVREFQTAQYGSGNTPIGGLTNDLFTLYVQALQGEMDPALRKAFVNSFGTLFHLPASQTNRLLEALIDEDDPELLEYLTGTRD